MSYAPMMSYMPWTTQGLGSDPVACDQGEEWDWNAMACVTAGQAVTPSPALPSSVPVPLPKPQPKPTPTPAPAASGPGLEQYIPWIVGGVVALSVLAVVATR